MLLNGSVTGGAQLTLTSGQNSQTASAYAPGRLNVQSFTTNFNFQLQNAQADGMMFVIQNAGPAAIGDGGGGLGFSGLAPSVGVKFDLYSNVGETPTSTGLYLNGASPTTPSQDLGAFGIDLHSGHLMNAALTYDGATLIMVLTDQVTGRSATFRWTVDIPGTVGGASAYVGFTAATGGLATTAIVNNWKFSSGSTPTSLIPGSPQCANENGTCNVPAGATASVYYGANNSFAILNGVSGSIICNNTSFGGDPLPGTVKACYVVVTTLPIGVTACAVDGGSCTIPAGSTATVFYGANATYLYAYGLSGTFACWPSTFGGSDPLYGVLKSCLK